MAKVSEISNKPLLSRGFLYFFNFKSRMRFTGTRSGRSFNAKLTLNKFYKTLELEHALNFIVDMNITYLGENL